MPPAPKTPPPPSEEMSSKKFDELESERAAVREKEEKERREEADKIVKGLEAEHERAEEERKRFENSVKPNELEKARRITDHDVFLHEHGLKHHRQPNEGDEDYSKAPAGIDTYAVETEAPDITPAPPDQFKVPMPYDPVAPPAPQVYPDLASKPS